MQKTIGVIVYRNTVSNNNMLSVCGVWCIGVNLYLQSLYTSVATSQVYTTN